MHLAPVLILIRQFQPIDDGQYAFQFLDYSADGTAMLVIHFHCLSLKL